MKRILFILALFPTIGLAQINAIKMDLNGLIVKSYQLSTDIDIPALPNYEFMILCGVYNRNIVTELNLNYGTTIQFDRWRTKCRAVGQRKFEIGKPNMYLLIGPAVQYDHTFYIEDSFYEYIDPETNRHLMEPSSRNDLYLGIQTSIKAYLNNNQRFFIQPSLFLAVETSNYYRTNSIAQELNAELGLYLGYRF